MRHSKLLIFGDGGSRGNPGPAASGFVITSDGEVLETGGRYVHLIADGDIRTSGDIAKALGCGADAVMLGEPLSVCAEAPAGGAWWHSAASHPKLPRGAFGVAGEPLGNMEKLLYGPSDDPDGGLNLFGGLKRAMAKCGYRDLKEFQKVGLVLDR